MSNTKNFFRFRKIVLDFFLWLCYYISVAWRQDPGVAKFGIALEWGSRGLEFESRHSDQKTRTTFVVLVFSFRVEKFEPSNANVLWTFARFRLDGNDTLAFRISTLGPKNQNNICCSGFFFSCGEIRTIKCECPVDICSFPAGRKRYLSVPNLDTRSIFHVPRFISHLFPNTRQPFSAKLSAGSKHSRMRHCQSAVPVLPRDGAFLSGYRNQQHCLCVYLFIHVVDPFNFSNC